MIQDPRVYGRREPAWVAFRDRWEDCHRLDCSFWDCLLTKASWIATNVSGPFVFNRDCWIVERGFLAFFKEELWMYYPPFTEWIICHVNDFRIVSRQSHPELSGPDSV